MVQTVTVPQLIIPIMPFTGFNEEGMMGTLYNDSYFPHPNCSSHMENKGN